jgi:beta-glucosidase
VESLNLPQRFAKAVKAGISIFSDNNDPSGLLAAVNQGLARGSGSGPVGEISACGDVQPGAVRGSVCRSNCGTDSREDDSYQLVADQAHRESIVLLRNDHQVLPFTSHVNLYVEVFTSGNGAAAQTAALKALFANDPMVNIVDNVAQATAALLFLQPTQVEVADTVDIKLSPSRGSTWPRSSRLRPQCRPCSRSTSPTAWVINDVEPGAAAVIGTFDVKANALIDLIRGRFTPKGKLPMSVPASQAAVDANASDIPGYLETFDYSYKNAVNDTYIFGFGKSSF